MLLVVQGMDTSGKGGIMRHVVGAVDPQGVHVHSFKAPTEEERAHDFLWRIEQALPAPGIIGVFDRSHYEDVLIARVRTLGPGRVVEARYEQINEFERRLAEQGTTVVKVMLHVSDEEQKERLAERLDRPDKYWKYNPGDVDERLLWDAYQEAYQVALTRCSTRAAPWYVVPADRKWYARLGGAAAAARAPSPGSTRSGRPPTSTSRPRRPGSPPAEAHRSRTSEQVGEQVRPPGPRRRVSTGR